jgi:DNA-binding LacI/PurR family transcriptional regulator
MGRSTPRLVDVAERAGVSNSTVSNAFNHPHRLDAALLQRVHDAATHVGYRGPNPIAAGLRTGTTKALAVFIVEHLSVCFTDPATRLVLGGIASVANDAGYNMLLVPGGQQPGLISAALADAAVAYSPGDDHALVAAARSTGLPLALIDRIDDDLTVPCVGIDDQMSARMQVNHLVQLGHPVLSSQKVRTRNSTWADGLRSPSRVNRERVRGWSEALRRHGLGERSTHLVWADQLSMAAGREGGSRLLSRPVNHRPTAIVCASDVLALGVLEAALTLGITVGQDLSVVGFDDIPGATGAGLTTISQPHAKKGSIAAAMALALARGRRISGGVTQRTLPTKLVRRSSTAPCPP